MRASTKNTHESLKPYGNFNTWIDVTVVSEIEIVYEYIHRYYEHIRKKTNTILFGIT